MNESKYCIICGDKGRTIIDEFCPRVGCSGRLRERGVPAWMIYEKEEKKVIDDNQKLSRELGYGKEGGEELMALMEELQKPVESATQAHLRHAQFALARARNASNDAIVEATILRLLDEVNNLFYVIQR